MRKIKAITVIFLCLCLSLPTICMSAEESEIAPYNIAIISTGLSFDITQSGTASCYGRADIRTGYTVQLTMQLQQKGSMWKTVQTWTNTDSSFVVFDETYQVEKGYEYRLMNVYIAYDANGNKVESFYDLSPVVEYN